VAATETTNGKLSTTPHINNRQPGIHILVLVSSHKPLELFSGFAQAPVDFAGTGVTLHLGVKMEYIISERPTKGFRNTKTDSVG
jgi:hypothetical protein